MAVMATAGQNDFGMLGGLDYFINPSGWDDSDYVANTTYVGTNYTSTSALAFDDFIDYGSAIGRFGDREKVIVCSSTFAAALQKQLRVNYSVERETYSNLDVGLPDYWAMDKFTAGFCDFYIMIDPNLDNVTKKIQGNVTGNATLIAASSSWAYVIDMSQIAVIYFDAMGKGIQTPHTANIDATDNNSIRRVEQDATFTLAIGDPRTCGVIAFS